MDDFLDRVWTVIEAFLNNTVMFLDTTLAPLETLGPGVVIFVLSLLVVGVTRLIARFYVTKRYVNLEKDFQHWKGVREEALKHPDREKGKTLAKNVDQAQLNRAFYDYFFEGLLKNLITNVLPILLMVVYVTKVYPPQALLNRFGDKWVFSFFVGTAQELNVSSLLWFAICLIFSFILMVLLKQFYKTRYVKKESI
jgi:hypothetical protein